MNIDESQSEPRRPGRPPKPQPSDDWGGDTLSLDEQLRLVDCQRRFQVYEQGQFVLGPNADPDALIAAALDGRENTTANLQLLHRHLKDSFFRGGVGFSGSPLFREVARRLRAKGLLPAPPPPQTMQDILRGRI
jgi:hypothetical protein